ncbi:MAG: AMP-binding protein [Actinobacteria bacterium]|nr:AMP-binding protein [Actinomycetota bacterium]MSW78013.1 AMP-binding protein [Actinomycetota bacterium]MSX55160.1 AMP-binding protein [Actinomycetota bacterium]MSZ83231.1 AMP-binding protein [Actinomycetota bacterium]MTB18164.1 AMP-binding protein [Actinomycetota bacterium]
MGHGYRTAQRHTSNSSGRVMNGATDQEQIDEGAAPSLHLPSWLTQVIELDPAANALHFEDTWRTWGWLGAGVRALHERLDAAGFGEGSMVGVLMRNRPEIVRAITGALATGRCLVTLSSAIPADKLADEIRRLRLPVIVATASDWANESILEAARDAGSLALLADESDVPFAIVVAAGERGDAPTIAPGVAVQMLTSGTTGPPKRIDLLYRSLEHEIVSTASYSRNSDLSAPRLSSGVSLVWNPLLHMGGLRALTSSLVAGRSVALMERFNVDQWAKNVREHRLRVVGLVPTALAMVLAADLPRDLFEHVQAVFAGTSPLDPELGRAFEEKYGVPVLEVYGATEFAGGVAGWTLSDRRQFGDTKTGSVGRPNQGVEVRVVDAETGESVPNGSVGLLEVRAPQLAQSGWTRTTDLAHMDDDQFLWITGRADDVIIRGGFKVATGEVGKVLAGHPSVLEACVIGLPDQRLGQVPVAAVQLRDDAEPITSEALLIWAREKLSGYQVPVELRIVAELPRTPSMKVSQVEVRNLFVV